MKLSNSPMTLLSHVLILFVLLTSSAFACIPLFIQTQSEEPVTIKVGDLFFQIPERVISPPRVPMERSHIQVGIPIREVLPSLASDNVIGEHNTEQLQIQILNEKASRESGTILKLTEQVRIQFPSSLSLPGKKFVIPSDTVESYIRSLSTPIAPDTWVDDVALTEMMDLGRDPCNAWQIPKRPQSETAKAVPYDAILKGIAHRNQEIRAAAAIRLAQADTVHKSDSLKRLQAVIRDDPSEYVRGAGVEGLAELAKSDETLIPSVVDIMLSDTSPYVQSKAMRKLSGTPNSVPVELLIAALNAADDTRFLHIGTVLAWVINQEVKDSGAQSPIQLSARANRALDGIGTILTHTTNVAIVDEMLTILRNSKGAAGRADFIALLTRLVAEGPGGISGDAAIALSQFGDKGSASIPLIIERMEKADNVNELLRLIQAFNNFGQAGKPAIPRLIELTAFKRNGLSETVPPPVAGPAPWQVRHQAVVALQFMGIRTAAIKAAFERASTDESTMVRSQAVAALKTFESN